MAGPKFITNDMKGGSIGGPTTPVRRGYVGSGLVYQGFSPASEQEFIQQTAPGGPAQLLKVYGKTIVWAQLVKNGDFSAGTNNWNGATSVVDGVATVIITATGTAEQGNLSQGTMPYIEGHIYLFYASVKSNNAATQINLIPTGRTSEGEVGYHYYPTWQRLSFLWTRATGNWYLNIRGYNSTNPSIDVDFSVKNVICIDLTDLYGAGHEPTSVAQFEADYPTYDPTYDPGSLQSNKTSLLRAERIPVINVWDEEWEVGSINASGVPVSSSTRIRSINYIPVTESTNYYSKSNAAGNLDTFFYNKEKGCIGHLNWGVTNTVFTTPADCAFIRIALNGTTYNHDICINLSDPAINGTYYPHWRGSLALNLSTLTGKLNGEGASVVVFPDGLRGVGTDRDAAYGSTGEVRMGRVDLGTLNYSYSAGIGGSNLFRTSLPADAADGNYLVKANILCAKYTTTSGSLRADKCVYISNRNLDFLDSSYTDPATFKAAMSGVMLDYPLATPLTYTLDTPLPTDLTCEQGDILQRVSDNNCPFVGEMKFGL